MSETNQSNDILMPPTEKPALPSGLNVLTILTLIWSAYELFSAFRNFTGGQAALEKLQQQQEKLESAPDWAKKMAGPEMMELMQKGIENRIPILVIGLISAGLCIYGALEMRKLKKQGYFLWLIGELLPWVGTIIFVGTLFFATWLKWMLIFPIIFILLYTAQRKHLRY